MILGLAFSHYVHRRGVGGACLYSSHPFSCILHRLLTHVLISIVGSPWHRYTSLADASGWDCTLYPVLGDLNRQNGPHRRPTDPVSVDVMTGCYNAANNKTPRADGTFTRHPHPRRWCGVTLRLPWAESPRLRADAVSRRARRGMEACKQPKRMMLKASQPLAGG